MCSYSKGILVLEGYSALAAPARLTKLVLILMSRTDPRPLRFLTDVKFLFHIASNYNYKNVEIGQKEFNFEHWLLPQPPKPKYFCVQLTKRTSFAEF